MGEMRLEVTTKGGDIGAGEIAMGEMRLEVHMAGGPNGWRSLGLER